MEEEIKIGEYIRTKNGNIDKAINLNYYMPVYVECENEIYLLDSVVKHSKQLIDLIKVGDYVNGYKVRGKTKEKIVVDYYCYSKELADGNWLSFNNDMIKTILTKELYEANCYKVGGEDE